MDSKHFKGHRVLLPYGDMTFWKFHKGSESHGKVSAKAEDDWDVCEVKVQGKLLPIMEVKLEDKSQGGRDMTFYGISNFLYQLQDIFEAGRKDKVKELRRVLEL